MERTKTLKKIFAVSDIHGCATALRAALDGAGFDPKDPTHLLLVLGDLFDRGEENREVLAYLKGIRNKILIRGNHEDILLDSITTGNVGRLQMINGTLVTLAEFFPYYHGESLINIIEPRQRATAEMLTELIMSMRDYFETDGYIFTHGWITEDAGESDFRYATRGKWHNARWLRWHKLYPHFEIPGGKTLVVGHTPAYYASMFDHTRSDYDCSIFYGKGMIAIDGKASSTGRVNVLVLEDYVSEPVTHELALTDAEHTDLARGKTRIHVRPFDSSSAELRVGDKIRFLDTGGANPITFVINALHLYKDVYELESEVYPYELGSITTGDGTLTAHLKTAYPSGGNMPLLCIGLQ